MRSIVIVDDEPIVLQAYQQILSKEFSDLHSFHTPDEAFKFINNKEDSLVITDIGMAGVDGEKFAQKLYKDFPNVKVIVTSGQLTNQLKNRLRESKNIIEMFDKPVHINDLVKVIHENLN